MYTVHYTLTSEIAIYVKIVIKSDELSIYTTTIITWVGAVFENKISPLAAKNYPSLIHSTKEYLYIQLSRTQ